MGKGDAFKFTGLPFMDGDTTKKDDVRTTSLIDLNSPPIRSTKKHPNILDLEGEHPTFFARHFFSGGWGWTGSLF